MAATCLHGSLQSLHVGSGWWLAMLVLTCARLLLTPHADPPPPPMPSAESIDMRDKAVVCERIKGSVSSKQYGYEDLLAPLIAGGRAQGWHSCWGV